MPRNSRVFPQQHTLNLWILALYKIIYFTYLLKKVKTSFLDPDPDDFCLLFWAKKSL